MSQPSAPIQVTDVADRKRYEIRRGEELAGYASYWDAPGGRRIVAHAEVDPALQGQGLGKELARGLLEDIRAHGWSVTPSCPFIARYIRDNPEYADLAKV